MKALLEIYRLRLRNTWLFSLVVASLATAGALVCHHFDLIEIGDSERGAYDKGLKVFTQGRGRSDDVVIVAIDQKSLDAIRANESYARNFGSWPYSRNIWARIFEQLQREGAKAIVFDATMDERSTDPANDLALGDALREKGIPLYLGFSAVVSDQVLPKVDAPVNRPMAQPPVKGAEAVPEEAPPEAAPEKDEAFPAEETFPDEDSGAALAQGSADDQTFEETFDEGDGAQAEVPSSEAYPATEPLAGARALAFPIVVRDFEPAVLEQLDAEGGVRVRTPSLPISPILEQVSGFGLVEIEPDEDGRMRRTRFVYTDNVNTYVTLPVAVAADLFGAKDAELSPGVLRIGERTFKVNADGSAEIDYGGPLDARFRTVPLVYVLDDWTLAQAGEPTRLEKGLFQDKVVFIGGFTVGLGDVKPTPFAPSEPGVVKQAALLQNFLDGEFIVEAPFWMSILLAFLVALFSISLITVIRSSAVEFIYPLALFFGFFLVTGLLLKLGKVHLLSALPTYAGELATFIGIIANHFFANKERERLKDAFSRFLSPEYVDRLVEQRQLPKLTGANREVTALVTDIEDFGALSERFKQEPHKLVRLLNAYLTRVSEVLLAHGACLDKYMGDSVVVLFGAPLDDARHAINACRAALAVRDAMGPLNAELEKEGLPALVNRIGMNSDEMFVGNVGSEVLVDYTAIGEGMNVAHRIERCNSRYRTSLLIGPKTRELAGESIVARELDWVRFPGRSEPLALYELLGMAEEVAPALQEVAALYAQALTRWRAGNFEESARILEGALAVLPTDGPSRALLDRCKKQVGSGRADAFDAVAEVV